MRVSIGVAGAEDALLPIDVTSGMDTDLRDLHHAKAAARSRARTHSE